MVAHLVMVLQEADKSRRRQLARGLPARSSAAKGRRLPLVGQALGEHAAEMLRRLGRVISVVTRRVAGHQDVQDVVEIVIPLRVVTRAATVCPPQVAGLIAVVFEDQMNFAIGDAAPDGLADFADDIGLALVENRVDGIEAQPVEMELLQPIERIAYEEIAHWPVMRPGKIDRGAPWRLVAADKEIWSDCRQIITLGTEVVVDDVQKDCEAACVTRLDEALQLVRPTVCRRRSVEKHTVITPIAASGKLRDRHQLDGRRAELGDMIEMLDRSGEVAGIGESAEVQLVENGLLPRTATPAEVGPIIRRGIDNF